MGRAKFSLNGDNFVGLLLNSKEGEGEYNRVLAGDFLFNFANKHAFRGNLIYSASGGENKPENSGMAYHLNYTYSTRPLTMDFLVEHFDQNFQMDTAFYEQVGITRFMGFFGPSFYPGTRVEWINRIRPSLYLSYIRDKETGLDEYLFRTNLWIEFPSQGALVFNYNTFKEIWLNQNFDGHFIEINSRIQATKWLFMTAYARLGDRVLYDPENPLVGDSRMLQFSTEINFSKQLSQFFQYTFQDLSDPVTEDLIYDVNVLTSRTTFQMNKYLFSGGPLNMTAAEICY